jgi:hypothetical protein
MSKIVWHEVTRNCHSGSLNDVRVLVVERPQKNRSDGTKHDWIIVVLGDPYTWNKVFCQYDPRDLASTKMAAESRFEWAVTTLHDALFKRPRRPSKKPCKTRRRKSWELP